MSTKLAQVKAHFWRDTSGKTIIVQAPNSLLMTWVALSIFAFLSHGHFKLYVNYAATAALFLWAVWEITQGANYFRRLLGLVVLVMIIVSRF